MVSSFASRNRLTAFFITLFLFCAYNGAGQSVADPIRVEISSQKPLVLHVTLRSTAETRATVYKYLLPWESRHSMTLVAVLRGGQCLRAELFIDDPGVERISLEPNETLNGDIDLKSRFRGLDQALKKSDIHLFWAYKAPEELGNPRWSGGWILIPKQN